MAFRRRRGSFRRRGRRSFRRGRVGRVRPWKIGRRM